MAVDTFTFQPAQAVQAQLPQGPVESSLRLTGGGPAGRTAGAPGGDFSSDLRGLEALQKIGNHLLAPHVERFKTQRAMDGAISALQGKAAAEIQSEELFQGIFGDSIAVASARQVEHLNAVNTLSNNVINSMPETRKMSPEEYRAFLPGELDRIKTGDPMTDAIITQGFLERLPSLVEAHTKSHVKYRQEVAHAAWSDHFNIASESYRTDAAAALRGELSPDRLLATQQALVAAMAGPGGISGEAYPTWITSGYKRLVAEGNFHAANVLEESGVFEAAGLTDQQIEGLQKARNTAESRQRSKDPVYNSLFGDIGVLMSDLSDGITVYQTQDELFAAIMEANEAHMIETGAREGIINPTMMQSLGRAWQDGMKKVNDPDAKWSAEKGKLLAVRSLMTGNIGADRDIIVSKTQGGTAAVDAALKEVVESNSDEYGVLNDNAILVLTRNHESFVTDAGLANRTKLGAAGFRDGVANEHAHATLANAGKLLKSERGYRVLQNLVGQDDAEFLARLHRETGGNVEEAIKLATILRNDMPGSKTGLNTMSPEVQEAVESWVNKQTAGAFMGFARSLFGVTNMRNIKDERLDEFRPALTAAITQEMANVRSIYPNMQVPQAMEQAVANLQDRGEFLLGHVLLSTRESKKFYERVGTKDPLGKTYNQVLDDLVREKFNTIQGHEKNAQWFGPGDRIKHVAYSENSIVMEVHDSSPKAGKSPRVWIRLTVPEVQERLRGKLELGRPTDKNDTAGEQRMRDLLQQ